ncbi:MAG: TRAM domain-containing protein [Actinomycetota bacterium]|nr:TRAM domain-containing protein [Actinomycetota bacterium]
MARPTKEKVEVGEEFTVEIGAMVHGGHCLAYAKGNTAFVRHALTGELARIRITEVRSKFIRADAIEIIEPSEHRVQAPCSWAHPGGCGGCDFQHVELAHQRKMKGAIARESLIRHAGVDPGDREAVALLDDHGLHWRTRVRWSVDQSGNVGLLAARSHGVLEVEECLLATSAVAAARVTDQKWPGVESVQVTVGSSGQPSVWADRELVSGQSRLVQQVRDRQWEIGGSDFWQVHPDSASAIVDYVLAAGAPRAGEHWLDLYAGAGLISAFLGHEVGKQGRVQAVESYRSSIRDGRRALADLPQVAFVEGDVSTWPLPSRIDGIVLDPPRRGAGIEVMAAIAAAQPRVVVYVACDPVAFARDAAFLIDAGYALDQFSVLDAFPMTHHMECIASFVPGLQSDLGPVQPIKANRLR